jgi:hygromycin-B 7''-O-kinase
MRARRQAPRNPGCFRKRQQNPGLRFAPSGLLVFAHNDSALAMTSFPSFENYETFRAWRADFSQWLPAAIDIARSHGVASASPHVFSTGTNLVVALDERLILKIFPPILRRQFISERGALAQLRGRLSIPIPEIIFEGERDRWPYLVITSIQGTEAWPSLPEEEKERVLAQIGETIAEVQRAPLGALAQIEPC